MDLRYQKWNYCFGVKSDIAYYVYYEYHLPGKYEKQYTYKTYFYWVEEREKEIANYPSGIKIT
jgi:hypothetical protein